MLIRGSRISDRIVRWKMRDLLIRMYTFLFLVVLLSLPTASTPVGDAEIAVGGWGGDQCPGLTGQFS